MFNKNVTIISIIKNFFSDSNSEINLKADADLDVIDVFIRFYSSHFLHFNVFLYFPRFLLKNVKSKVYVYIKNPANRGCLSNDLYWFRFVT